MDIDLVEDLIKNDEYLEAAKLLYPLVERDDPLAKFFAAELALNSIPTHRAIETIFGEVTDDKAIQWLKQAADKGVPEAQYHYSEIYFEDHENDGETTKIMAHSTAHNFHNLRYLARSAKSGYTDALFDYGELLASKENSYLKKKGLNFIEEASNKGHIEATLHLLLSTISNEKDRISVLIESIAKANTEKYFISGCLSASSLISILIDYNFVSLKDYDFIGQNPSNFYDFNNFRWDSSLDNFDFDGRRSNNALAISNAILRRTNTFLQRNNIDNPFIKKITRDLFSVNCFAPEDVYTYAKYLNTTKESHNECIEWIAFLAGSYTEILYLVNSHHIRSNLEQLYLKDDNLVKEDETFIVKKPISFYTLPAIMAQLSPAVPEVRLILEEFLRKDIVIDLKGLSSFLPKDSSTSLLKAFIKPFLIRHPKDFSYLHTFVYNHAKYLDRESVESISNLLIKADSNSDSWILDTAFDLFCFANSSFDHITTQPIKKWIHEGLFNSLPLLEEFLNDNVTSESSDLILDYKKSLDKAKYSVRTFYSHIIRIGESNPNKQKYLINIWSFYLAEQISSSSKFESLKGIAHIQTLFSNELEGLTSISSLKTILFSKVAALAGDFMHTSPCISNVSSGGKLKSKHYSILDFINTMKRIVVE